MLVGGVIQYGAIFATKHALIQIGRDVGRWAATQDSSPCNAASTQTPPQPVTEADALARESQMMGYLPGDWNASNFTPYSNNTAMPQSPPHSEGVEVVWSYATGSCPPADSSTAAFVTVRLSHRAPNILPGSPTYPALGRVTLLVVIW